MDNRTTDMFAQEDVPAKRNVRVFKQAEKPEFPAQLSQQFEREPNQTTVSPATPQVIYQPIEGTIGLP